ncbi:hypothetical protein G039_0333980 [Pseudomonas aeruginosa VRFPA01]|nr:hypothetical protein G039_0333980 [Pseudomonas aeruginosa VRFPA01]
MAVSGVRRSCDTEASKALRNCSVSPCRRAASRSSARPVAGGAGQAHGVVEHLVVERQVAGDPLQGEDVLVLQQRPQAGYVEHVAARRAGHLAHQGLLLGFGRVVDAQLEHEAVEFGFRQRVGALLLDRVLRRQHHERLRHRQGAAFQGHLALLHHFQQGGLGLGRGAVDLVGQQQVGEHRALAQLELLAGEVVHGVTGDVAGHQVGGELDTREAAVEATRQGAHQEGLAEPRDAFHQHVAAGEQRGEHVVDHRTLADQGFLQFVAQGLRQLAGALALERRVGRGARLFGRLFAHRAFLRLCRWATWRVKSAAESRCAG